MGLTVPWYFIESFANLVHSCDFTMILGFSRFSTNPPLLHSLLTEQMEGMNILDSRPSSLNSVTSCLGICARKCQLLSTWKPQGPGPTEEQSGGIPSCQGEWLSLIPALFGKPQKSPWVICFVTLLAFTVYVKYIKQEYSFKIL